ncbi:hypothetical protein G9272_41115 [Streptomyces asoensis]|uniref:Uncharacterized protein n=1 Tax=Streptomyces asoensis TaxID=249586 RepID=A0A6M4X181_9ACTN|nr:hypothetical protein [Streptomyces asoensis]QJT05942.1 hypothetical protein G9272_41115 [Streptomyces asoensis]
MQTIERLAGNGVLPRRAHPAGRRRRTAAAQWGMFMSGFTGEGAVVGGRDLAAR